MQYHMTREVGLSYDEAVSKVTDELKTEGFGVLTEIDVKATLKKKLDVDYRRYVILGACNPSLAYQALQAEEKVGVFLPCNVCVYETSGGKVTVSAMDPGGALEMIGNPKLTAVGREARERIARVLAAL